MLNEQKLLPSKLTHSLKNAAWKMIFLKKKKKRSLFWGRIRFRGCTRCTAITKTVNHPIVVISWSAFVLDHVGRFEITMAAYHLAPVFFRSGRWVAEPPPGPWKTCGEFVPRQLFAKFEIRVSWRCGFMETPWFKSKKYPGRIHGTGIFTYMKTISLTQM